LAKSDKRGKPENLTSGINFILHKIKYTWRIYSWIL